MKIYIVHQVHPFAILAIYSDEKMADRFLKNLQTPQAYTVTCYNVITPEYAATR